MPERAGGYSFTALDLVDVLANHQIKEVLLPGKARGGYAKEMAALEGDLDARLAKARVKDPARLLRLIALNAQANLMVWRLKDRMREEPRRYSPLLEKALEVNVLKNAAGNSILRRFGELTPARARVGFLHPPGRRRWYSRLAARLP